MVDLVDLSGMAPAAAAEKLAYLAIRIHHEQTFVTPFIRDPRPEVYLQNEIRAYWEGRITEFHGWTDPVGQAIQKVYDDLVAWVTGLWTQYIYPVFRPVVDWVHNQASRIWEWILEIYNKLCNIAGGIVDSVVSGVSVVNTWIRDALNTVWHLVQSEFAAGWQFVRGLLESYLQAYNAIGNAIRDMLVGAWESITTTVSGAWETLSQQVIALPEAIAAGFQSAISYVYDVLKKFWDEVLVPVGQAIHDGISWVVTQIHVLWNTVWDSLRNILSAFAPISPEKGEHLGLALLGISGLAAGGLLAMTAVWDVLHPIKDIIPGEIKAMIYDVTNFKLILGGLAGALITAAIIQPAKYNYNALLRPYLPRLGDAEQMLHRGLIDEDHYLRLAHYNGYSDYYSAAYLELTNQIPSPHDLVTFVVREVALMPQDYETPDFFLKNMKMHGYEPYWARAFWWSHWVLPAFNHMQNAFFRGIITQEEFTKFVIWHDYSPVPRPGISKSDTDIMSALIYDLPQRLQSRMMRRWGVITTDEHRDLLAKSGLHPDWLERTAQAEMMNLLQDERTSLRTALKNQFLWGMIDSPGFRKELTAVNFTPEEVDLSIEASEAAFKFETLKDGIEAARQQYRLRKISIEELQARLAGLGINENRIERIVSVELARAKEINGETEQEKVYAYGSSVALARFTDGISSDADLVQELHLLGYNDNQIGVYKIMGGLKLDHDYAKAVISTAKTAYKKAFIQDAGFIELLRNFGVQDWRIIMELNLLKLALGIGLQPEDIAS